MGNMKQPLCESWFFKSQKIKTITQWLGDAWDNVVDDQAEEECGPPHHPLPLSDSLSSRLSAFAPASLSYASLDSFPTDSACQCATISSAGKSKMNPTFFKSQTSLHEPQSYEHLPRLQTRILSTVLPTPSFAKVYCKPSFPTVGNSPHCLLSRQDPETSSQGWTWVIA
jgi:hypothetical protein